MDRSGIDRKKCTERQYKTRTRKECNPEEARKNLRVVIATIDIPDVDIVASPLQYQQQAGRAGRDGQSALNMSYVFKRSHNLCSNKNMKEFAIEDSRCLSYKLLSVFISRISRYLDIIRSLILSRLDYANAILLGTNSSSIARLQKLQNWAARIILCAKKGDHATPLFKELH